MVSCKNGYNSSLLCILMAVFPNLKGNVCFPATGIHAGCGSGFGQQYMAGETARQFRGGASGGRGGVSYPESYIFSGNGSRWKVQCLNKGTGAWSAINIPKLPPHYYLRCFSVVFFIFHFCLFMCKCYDSDLYIA